VRWKTERRQDNCLAGQKFLRPYDISRGESVGEATVKRGKHGSVHPSWSSNNAVCEVGRGKKRKVKE